VADDTVSEYELAKRYGNEARVNDPQYAPPRTREAAAADRKQAADKDDKAEAEAPKGRSTAQGRQHKTTSEHGKQTT
jgi:hypothetical protein